MTLLALQAENILNAALTSPHGLVVRIHATADVVQPATRGRQTLYYFKNLSEEYKTFRIDVMGDDELWITKRNEA